MKARWRQSKNNKNSLVDGKIRQAVPDVGAVGPRGRQRTIDDKGLLEAVQEQLKLPGRRKNPPNPIWAVLKHEPSGMTELPVKER